tara:strand:- start:1705 stop:2145 length:441 start_codon:yes stop_codon:yes gene_type:complete
MLFLMLGAALAADPIARPAQPETVEGECAKVFPISRGQPFPIQIVGTPANTASCGAVVVPLSDYSDLLKTEKWGEALYQQYKIDVAELESERDWYKGKLEEEMEPPPFLERPATQRWFGRIETLVTVGVVAAGLGAAYQYGAGGSK